MIVGVNSLLLKKNNQGDPFFDDVSLLLHFNGADSSTSFIDETGKTVTPNGNAQIDTTQGKFGGASGLFDGNGDYLQLDKNADFEFGTGDFTLEVWFYVTSLTADAAEYFITYQAASPANNTDVGFVLGYSATTFRLSLSSGSTRNNYYQTATILEDDWNFGQITRESGTLKMFLNGSEVLSTSNTQNINTDTDFILRVGAGGTNFFGYYEGWLDDLRITKGAARENLVPSSQFPDA